MPTFPGYRDDRTDPKARMPKKAKGVQSENKPPKAGGRKSATFPGNMDSRTPAQAPRLRGGR